MKTNADTSKARMIKQIKKELNLIREEAKTNDATFKYQTILWTMYRKIEETI